MPSPEDNKRKHILFKRKTIRVVRRFDVEYIGDSTLKYTCRTCGHSVMKKRVNPAGKPLDEAFTKRLAVYQNDSNGASGVCKHCTKLVQDERYPLPSKHHDK